jgi:hypothetical protein
MRQPDSISYLDDDNKVVQKYCTVIEENQTYVKFRYSETSPTITVTWDRILKLKQGVGK